LTTISCAIEFVPKLTKMKLEDAEQDEQKMHRLANLVCFENAITDEMRSEAEKAGITLYTMEEVIMKGREV